MSGHLTFKELPKVNDCKSCQGTGVVRWYDLDGGPYYSWMKPQSKPCIECKSTPKELPL